MKFTKFQDMNGKEIQVSMSGGGDTRIYFEADKDDSPCMLLNEHQAKILIHAISDLIKDENESDK